MRVKLRLTVPFGRGQSFLLPSHRWFRLAMDSTLGGFSRLRANILRWNHLRSGLLAARLLTPSLRSPNPETSTQPGRCRARPET